MTLGLVGTLPVSGVSLGLAMAPPVLAAEVSQLGLDITNLGLALAVQIEAGLNRPSLAGLLTTLQELQAALVSIVSVDTLVTAGVLVNADAVLQLGVISVALALVLEVDAAFELGLGACGIAAWTYSGPASGLAACGSNGFAGLWSRGLVVATESLDTWGQFGASVNTGASGTAPAAGPATLEGLGQLSGAEICTGLLELKSRFEAFRMTLDGLKASLELQIQVSLGLNLPDLSQLAALLSELMTDVAGLFDNLINVSVDLSAEISGIQARLDTLLALSLSVGAQLSAGGLALWLYTGFGTLGFDISETLATGLPGGSGPAADIRALVLAATEPSEWEKLAPLLGGL